MQTYPLVINGESITDVDAFDVINPATAEPFARCATATVDHANAAVAAAKAAFDGWRSTSEADRQGILHQLGALLEEHTQELAELISKETGKPIGGLNNVGAMMELGGSVAWTHVTADLELPVEVLQDDEQARLEIHRKPLGVVAAIAPWNWPLMIAIWQIIPALRAGNTVVMKPSPFTPIATARFVELANTVLPKGVLNLISGGPELGAVLTEHQDVAKVTFTGSTQTGQHIMRSAAGNLKRLTLELGGNDAAIVLNDVDVKAIAPQLVGALFHNNGQTCACLKRLYVHEDIYDDLCAELVKHTKDIKVADGMSEGAQLGPLQNERQLNIVKAFADSVQADGGEFLCGGSALPGAGYFFEPTLVAGLSNGSKLVDEEPFGPIAPIVKFSTVDEAIAMANDNPAGLGGSVWSADFEKASELAKQLECGIAWVNEHGGLRPDAPFGGVKNSGIGVEFNRHGLEEFTSIQTVITPK